ncbi:hypothetical protein BKA67DRAFT_19989 [Truncatella angustata]|uniref:C2H2-type domain-containing protein n=1 Tax=Truncatella angustata TaxID=152316 RepID=A0A9P9A1J6_9PEZI|nr:uncharacterized protein BKA67DRAFT_19989 [Truncatella angustata]KAH6659611.1 hypothetical protein BKA67DRAFT_19989 [Truncatella angustata]
MESKKGSGTVEVRSATTDISVYDQEGPTPRRMTQRIRDSVELRRNSGSSLSPEVIRSTTSVSCVTRQASEDDCAKQRFIVWAAVKRNRSIRMAASDRLRCPLVRCGEQFGDHETMLRHLSRCRHLETGEYLCYDCMRVERFNDGKCKCCLGHQTKRRRIINAAKKVFSTLGHKPRRAGSSEIGQDEFMIPPPPSYESLDIESNQDEDQELQLPIEPEISGNPISEMDAQTMFPVELASINYEPQQDISQPLNDFDAPVPVVSHFVTPPLPGHSLQNLVNNNGSRPSLTLDTHNTGRPNKVPRTTFLSPSSSLRSNNSSQGIISPLSAASGLWANESSIDTTLASPITPFSSDAESSSLSRENSCKFPKDFRLPSLLSSWNDQPYKSRSIEHTGLATSDSSFTLNNVSELPGDMPLNMALPRSWGVEPLTFSLDPKDNYSWSSTVDTQVNVLFTGNNDDPNMESEEFNCDARTLVSHTWETLKEQMTFSMPNVAHINNSLARQLEMFSPKDMILRGLKGLQRILCGTDLNDPLDYLCFVHLIYAFSFVIHEEDVSTRIDELFKQALAYRNFLPARDRDSYSALVTAIWEPRELETSNSQLGRSSSLKGKELELRDNTPIPFKSDPLVAVAQNFLDDLETSLLGGNNTTRPLETMTSELYSIHIAETGPTTQLNNDAFSITVNYIIQVLSQKFGPLSKDLVPKLRAVGQKVTSGYVTTIRCLELELLQAGKNALPALELFQDYIPQVRGLCDPIYSQRGSNPRSNYQRLGVALVESLVQNIDAQTTPVINLSTSDQVHDSTSDFSLDLPDDPDFVAAFLKDFDNSALAGENFIDPTTTSLEQTDYGSKRDTSHIIPTATGILGTDHTTVDPQSLNHTGSETENSILSRPEKTIAYEHKTIHQNDVFTAAPTSVPSQKEESSASTPAEGNTSGPRTEANDCCEICGYRPKGDPQWFKGSMAKHKKLQHSKEPPKIYRCKFPGCTSAYKNRPDNLRQHQIEKDHFVEGEGNQKRPTKRKKPDDD